MLGRKPQLLRGGCRAGLHPVKVAGQNVRARKTRSSPRRAKCSSIPGSWDSIACVAPGGRKSIINSSRVSAVSASAWVALGLGQELIYRVDLA